MAANFPRVGAACSALACASFDPSFGEGAETSRADCRGSLSPHDLAPPLDLDREGGARVEVSGVATLALDHGSAAGFFLQSLETDSDPLTPESVFVTSPSGTLPAPGTRVRVRGELAPPAGGIVQLVAVERLDQCERRELEPVPLDARRLEPQARSNGMWVEARGSWALVHTSAPGHDGSVIASANGRLYASGHPLGRATAPAELWSIEPASVGADDAESAMPPRLDATLEQVIGVLAIEGETRRLYTTHALDWRASTPPVPARRQVSSLRIAALNLDNYFLDLRGPGARTESELLRQREKLAAALLALDADILALTELENGGSASLAHLLAALASALPAERAYTFSESSPSSAAADLRAAIAFRAERIDPRGEAWFDERPGFRRPPLFQSFASSGGGFTLGVVHFKSKRCEASARPASVDGCGDAERRAEAELLIEATRPFGASSPPEPLLVLGDFNSDALEAPLATLGRAGFVDLLEALPAADRYSYVFDGRASLLDHALAQNLRDRCAGVAIWHVNADEPSVRGYSLDNPPRAYAADERRCSDHDPVIVDLRP